MGDRNTSTIESTECLSKRQTRKKNYADAWRYNLWESPPPLPDCLANPKPQKDSARKFFRVLFGKPFGDPQMPGHKLGTDLGIDLAWLSNNPEEQKRKIQVLVFGKDNFARLSDMGLDCVLLDDRPSVLSGEHPYSLFMNRFLAFKAGMEMCDEAVFLDIDCEQVTALPDDFWENHGEKAVIQSPLIAYYSNERGRYWRKEEHCRVSTCGCYVYLRGRQITDMLLDKSREMMAARPGKFLDDEMVMDKLIDDTRGGWTGATEYAKHHMPPYFVGMFRLPEYKGPTDVFCHYENRMGRTRKLERLGKWPLKYPFVGAKG
jgi:hypothetical protein